jgi:5-methyltetrahydropteroyltriglutamate--homocysteine methyltransferase
LNRSTERILTTHSGSLSRTAPIIEGMKAKTLRKPVDEAELQKHITAGIAEVVRKQVEAGLDIVNDGEYARRGFTSYIHERIGGLQPLVLKPGEKNPLDQIGHEIERDIFPGFYAQHDKAYRFMWMLPEVDMSEMKNIRGKSEIFKLVAPLSYAGDKTVQRDISNLKSALTDTNVADAFITAVTPTTERRDAGILDFYKNLQEYRYAIAEVLNKDYKAIVDAGFVLQLDRPAQNPVLGLDTDEEIVRTLEEGIEVVNHALRGIPEDRVRIHWCGGSGNRPHTQNIPIAKMARSMLKLKVGAFGIEAATPRHEHEYRIWEDIKLPEGKILIPGVISQSTNVVEHPECVAWRITNFANLVGRENVIAGVDCGFSQDWDLIRVHPEVQWAKLRSLAEGAAIASKKLWN